MKLLTHANAINIRSNSCWYTCALSVDWLLLTNETTYRLNILNISTGIFHYTERSASLNALFQGLIQQFYNRMYSTTSHLCCTDKFVCVCNLCVNIIIFILCRTWEEGKVIVFDDSFEHEVWHDGSKLRLVLIVDIWHPELTSRQKASLSPI